jgi:dihydrofolate reductase
MQMRKVVLAMMATLNGRLDDPIVWMSGVDDRQYTDIRDAFRHFDTVVVGRVTFEEMAAYWPGAEAEKDGPETNRSMARMMNAYQKFVVSSNDDLDTSTWNNTQGVSIRNDDDLVAFVDQLKARPGKDIHVAGGARLAQTFVRLDLIDEYRLATYPIVSPGACWFDQIDGARKLTGLGARSYDNGVTRFDFAPERDSQPVARPETFSDMIRENRPRTDTH